MQNSFKKIVITGGAGFIGSHVTDGLLQAYPNAHVTVFDLLTYAGHRENLAKAETSGRMTFVHGDVRDETLLKRVLNEADLVVHAAAESHVDRSFSNSQNFISTNVVGTQTLLDACRACEVSRVIHISTDEIYGPREKHDPASEISSFAPTNPYSASKAAAEMLVQAAFSSHNLPVISIRPNNVYGTRQHSEKLLPRFIELAAQGVPLTIHGSGQQQRRFLAVEDLVSALILLAENGEIGQAYNVGTIDVYSVLEIANMVTTHLGISQTQSVDFVEDRLFNDFLYATDCQKIRKLGWKPTRRLSQDFVDLYEHFASKIGLAENTEDNTLAIAAVG